MSFFSSFYLSTNLPKSAMYKFLKWKLLVTLYFTVNFLVYSQVVKSKVTSNTLSSTKILSPDPDLFAKKWISQPLPTFSLADTQGNVYNSDSLRGKVIVIDFWSVYSVPCLMEMPYLSELAGMYANKDVVFLAPTSETLAQIQHTFSKSTFTYTVLPQAQALILAMHVEMQPTHIIADKKGIINAVYIGLYQDPVTNQLALDKRLNDTITKLLKN